MEDQLDPHGNGSIFKCCAKDCGMFLDDQSQQISSPPWFGQWHLCGGTDRRRREGREIMQERLCISKSSLKHALWQECQSTHHSYSLATTRSITTTGVYKYSSVHRTSRWQLPPKMADEDLFLAASSKGLRNDLRLTNHYKAAAAARCLIGQLIIMISCWLIGQHYHSITSADCTACMPGRTCRRGTVIGSTQSTL